MSKITDHIWIGSFADSRNGTLFKQHHITHVLSCAEEFCTPPKYIPDANFMNLPIVDNEVDSKTTAQFRRGAAQLNKWIQAGGIVMVHCWAGISRSVSTVIAYLILYKGLSYAKAYALIKKERPSLHPHPSYVKLLKSMAAHLRNKTRKIRSKYAPYTTS
jgi:atypical dual specificity phosphatase